MRDSFVFYRSWADSIEMLPKTQQIDVYKSIVNYALKGNEPKLSGTANIIFELIKPLLDANNKRYIDGCKGGRPKADEDDSPQKNIEGAEYFIITEKQYDSACERLGKDVVDRTILLIDNWFAKKNDNAKKYIGRNNYGFLRSDNSFVVQAKEMIEKEKVRTQPNWSI